MKDYINVVNEYFNVEIADLTRKKEIRQARQIYSYCINKLNKYTYLKIAESVGLKQHSTIIHSIKTIENDINFDANLKKDVDFILYKFKEIRSARELNGFTFDREVSIIDKYGKITTEKVFRKI